MRIVLSAIVVVPLYVCPVFLIKSSKFVLPIFFIKYALPTFLAGFLLFGYSKILYERFNLVNDEDTNVALEKAMNMGRFEEQEDVREFVGKKNSKLYEEGQKLTSAF